MKRPVSDGRALTRRALVFAGGGAVAALFGLGASEARPRRGRPSLEPTTLEYPNVRGPTHHGFTGGTDDGQSIRRRAPTGHGYIGGGEDGQSMRRRRPRVAEAQVPYTLGDTGTHATGRRRGRGPRCYGGTPCDGNGI